MNKSIVLFLGASICIILPATTFAAGLCCQLSSGVQESLSGVATPVTGETSVQFNYSFTRMDKFKEGSTERSLDYVKMNSGYTSLPVTMDMMKYTMTAGYGFSPLLKVFVSVPYIRNTMDMTTNMGMNMTREARTRPRSGRVAPGRRGRARAGSRRLPYPGV